MSLPGTKYSAIFEREVLCETTITTNPKSLISYTAVALAQMLPLQTVQKCGTPYRSQYTSHYTTVSFGKAQCDMEFWNKYGLSQRQLSASFYNIFYCHWGQRTEFKWIKLFRGSRYGPVSPATLKTIYTHIICITNKYINYKYRPKYVLSVDPIFTDIFNQSVCVQYKTVWNLLLYQ